MVHPATCRKQARLESLKPQLIQSFANQNVTQTALQQLQVIKQQQNEPVAQFAVRFNQLLLRAGPTMSEDMKLFFLWPRLRHDIARRVRDQGPTKLRDAIQNPQRIEATSTTELPNTSGFQLPQRQQNLEDTATPMDIDV